MPKGVYIRTEEWRKLQSEAHKGYIQTSNQIEKRRMANIRDYIDNPQRRLRMKESTTNSWKLGVYKDKQPIGEKHPLWKGNNVGYDSLHDWVNLHKPKIATCENCGCNNKKLGASNISRKYLRDVNDYEWLCYPCHMKKDRSKDESGSFMKLNFPIRDRLRVPNIIGGV